MKKILLLGSGELGKEVVIAAKRLGCYVVAVDSYDNAPAMQVADERIVINMLDGNSLDAVVDAVKPDIIVPEIEAIRTERLHNYEDNGITVVPSARATNFTMNRKAVRDLASKELSLRTAKYCYATSLEEFRNAVKSIGIPCVAKPLMSSSGKGQSTISSHEQIDSAWSYAIEGSRGDVIEVIVEEFIPFHTEITLLTVTQHDGPTLFCPPIGHRQERGDFQESWQPCHISENDLAEAQEMARKITTSLTGVGLWGVEFFLTEKGVYFSELSPRPHDTGMVTLGGTQNLNEFELHVRSILHLPIPEIRLEKAGASAVILSYSDTIGIPSYRGVEVALRDSRTDVKIFGKPTTRKFRRMGIVLTWDEKQSDLQTLRIKAEAAVKLISVETH